MAVWDTSSHSCKCRLLELPAKGRDVQDCHQRLSSAFDLLSIFHCSLIPPLTLTSPPNNALLANLHVVTNIFGYIFYDFKTRTGSWKEKLKKQERKEREKEKMYRLSDVHRVTSWSALGTMPLWVYCLFNQPWKWQLALEVSLGHSSTCTRYPLPVHTLWNHILVVKLLVSEHGQPELVKGGSLLLGVQMI